MSDPRKKFHGSLTVAAHVEAASALAQQKPSCESTGDAGPICNRGLLVTNNITPEEKTLQR
jgi:hypothetical protein